MPTEAAAKKLKSVPLTPVEAAKLLRVGYRTCVRLMESGQLKHKVIPSVRGDGERTHRRTTTAWVQEYIDRSK
jgi:excisionase family DNA binding protein